MSCSLSFFFAFCPKQQSAQMAMNIRMDSQYLDVVGYCIIGHRIVVEQNKIINVPIGMSATKCHCICVLEFALKIE